MRSAAVILGLAALLAGCMPANVIEPSQTETVKPIRVARPCRRA